jgi:hypothetical protein
LQLYANERMKKKRKSIPLEAAGPAEKKNVTPEPERLTRFILLDQ